MTFALYRHYSVIRLILATTGDTLLLNFLLVELTHANWLWYAVWDFKSH